MKNNITYTRCDDITCVVVDITHDDDTTSRLYVRDDMTIASQFPMIADWVYDNVTTFCDDIDARTRDIIDIVRTFRVGVHNAR